MLTATPPRHVLATTPQRAMHALSGLSARAAARILSRFPRRAFLDPAVFSIWQDAGYSVVPNHFYAPIPDLRSLEARTLAPSCCQGIDLNEPGQLAQLERFRPYVAEFSTLDTANGYFGPVDSEALYGFVRSSRPDRVIEVGSGYSTVVLLKALAANDHGELITVEPYEPGRMPIAPTYDIPVQDVPLDEFRQLKANDILFLDTSHVAKVGGDVTHLFLEVLPILAPGVLVHIHDIFLPHDYPEAWVKREHRFWTEQYLLHALLIFNERIEVIWASNYLARQHRREVESLLGPIGAAQPGSFWMRMVGA